MTTRYLTCAETAKLVRKALKEAFPDVKFSVRSNVYSGGASLSVNLGIPRALGHPFHEHLDSDSTLTWTLIPRPLGH